MNWITDHVKPKLWSISSPKTEVPSNLWHRCPDCEQMLFHRDLEDHLHVCQHCGHHLRISARKRLTMLFDDGKFDLIPVPAVPTDPLKFKDNKKYADRLKTYRQQTNENDAILVGYGKIGDHETVIAAFDFFFMGGSMGMAVGEGLIVGAQTAVKKRAPFLAIPASGGARMQEGVLSLMQMPRSIIAVQLVREAKLPYIVILTDPTTGGVSASFAMVGDITIAEPRATIGFTGARVIQDTVREKLPEGFQKSEYLREHGMVDMVVPRNELRAVLRKIFGLLSKKN